MPKRLEKVTKTWGLGMQSALEPELIKRGGFSRASNFVASIDKVELLGGRVLTGDEEAGNTPCLGLGSIQQQNGEWVMYRKNGTTLESYSFTTNAWTTVKTGLIADEEIYFDNSYTPAGRQTWACGQDGLLKIYPSSPASPLDLTSATKNYKGKLKIEKSRMIVVAMAEDPTGIRLSKIDKDSNYTTVSGESVSVDPGDTYSGTLAHTQVFGLVFTKGAQTVTDDKNGNLIGDGTGTINYATGAYSVVFDTSNADVVDVDYLWEDPLTGGIADFTYSASRVAGEGNVLRQDATGTKSLNVVSFNNSYYTLQDRGSWYLTINSTDEIFDNQIFNTMVSCSSPEGSVEVKDGIIFIDTTEIDKPKLRKLSLNQLGDKVIPIELSELFDLTGYTFDDTPMIQFNDFIIFSGASVGSSFNDTTFVYSLETSGFFTAPGGYTRFIKANGALFGGDASSPNVYQLFTGYDDLDYPIEGYIESGNDNLDTEQVKKEKKFYIEGYLSGTQAFDLYLAFDKGSWQHIGEVTMQDIVVGADSETFGSVLYGLDVYGGSIVPIQASWYKKAFRIVTPKHERVMWRLVPSGIGYLAVTQQKYSDIRKKGTKVLRQYK